MKTIEKAAIIYQGKVYTGWRHDRIGLKMVADRVCPIPYPGGKAQGFVTNEGEFVSRGEALRIAMEAGQTIVKSGHPSHLFSEEIWDVNGNPRKQLTKAQHSAIMRASDRDIDI